jgi:rhodanese-related sulfurtransferase
MKARSSIFTAALVAASLLVPGYALAQNYPPSVGQMVAATKKQIKTINMEQFRALVDKKEAGHAGSDGLQPVGFRPLVDNKEAGLIIDVRQEDEYADGHVPGAINIPRGLIEFRIWKSVGFPDKVDMNRQLTLYCLSGARCALAAKSLQDLGFTNVTSVDMKFEDWVKAGNPVAKPK